MAKRPKIGDVVEIKTSKGLAYAQYQNKHPMYGGLIRVLPGLFERRPEDWSFITSVRERFVTFVPLGTMVHRGIVEIVAHCPLPEHAKPFPLFRTGTPPPKTHKVERWWYWDGEQDWPIEKFTEEHRSLPILGCWTPPFLVDRIESGWSPATDDC